MQKLVVFGGTGMTGQCVVNYALKKGFHVRLLVRSEVTVPASFKNQVELMFGNVTNFSDVCNALKDQEIVCVTLGTRNELKPTTIMSTGLSNIVDGMKANNLTKVSVCLSSFLFFDPNEIPKQFIEVSNDHRRMLEILKNSQLEFRAILPPHIANEPQSEYCIAYDKSPGFSRSISKMDLAEFLIECLFDDKHAEKIIGICTKSK